MRTPSLPYGKLDLAPPSADQFVFGVAPPRLRPRYFSASTFGFRLTADTLPSGSYRVVGSRSALAWAPL